MNKVNDFSKRRFFKVKHAQKEFLCALCKAPRQLTLSNKLTLMNYFQIIIISAALGWPLYSIMKEKVIFILFVVWPVFEMSKRLLYRKQVPCPYCGFDATWYRRDVKIARKKVEEFWNKEEQVSDHDPAMMREDSHLDDIEHDPFQ